jgi:hypothetical protein
MEKYICPTHYQPWETVELDNVTVGMRLEVHIRAGKYAGRELYFTVKYIFTDCLDDGTLHLMKRDLVQGQAELRNRDAQQPPAYPMVEGEGAAQYSFDVPNETQLALF